MQNDSHEFEEEEIEEQQSDPELASLLNHPVFLRMNENVKHSLNSSQAREIIKIIPQITKKHPVDLRGVIPFFFSKYYFVLLMGKDTRKDKKIIINDSRVSLNFFKNLAGILVFLTFPVMFVSFIYFILVK